MEPLETPHPGTNEGEAARVSSCDPLDTADLIQRIEDETNRATAFAVFKPDDEATWAQVRHVTQAVLDAFWTRGELVGETREDAYFVRVGAETMTQQDIDAGRLIIVVGVAPIRPAEFVILRIGQMVQPP